MALKFCMIETDSYKHGEVRNFDVLSNKYNVN